MPQLGTANGLPASPGYLQVPTWNGTAWVPRQNSGLKNSTTPEAFGAVGNTPANDDAPAIEAAIASVVAACIADGSYACEVVFDAGKKYYANRAPVQNPTINGSPSYAYAQIALPYVDWSWVSPNSTPLVTLTLRSQVQGQAANTTFVNQPAAIVTTPTTGAGRIAAGIPSVIGGPAFKGPLEFPAVGQQSGINLVVDGLNIVSPVNPVFCGMDLKLINTCDLLSLHVYVPSGGYTAPANASNGYAYGVMLPGNQNGGKIRIGTLAVYGYFCGISMSEHLIADNIMLYWNRLAISYDKAVDHESWISYLQTSGNANLIGFNNGGSIEQVPSILSGPAPLSIGLWGLEDVGAKIWDQNNQLRIRGTICGVLIGGETRVMPPMDGGAQIKLESMYQPRGVVTAPTVPATTVAYKNIFGHDAWVIVSGGTVTDISINSVSTGFTSGQVLVPNGGTITMTYSSAPTWKWWLL